MKKLVHDCAICENRPNGIFCDLAGPQLARLEREKTSHIYQPGNVIFYEGNPPFAFYCIFSGLIKLYKTNKKGDEYIIRLLRAGDIVGYRPIFENEEYAATAQAVETCVVCTIRKDTLTALIRESPELAMRFLAKMAYELRISEEQMLAFAQDTVRRRTARVLLFLMQVDQNTSNTAAELSVPLLRREIAQMIGTSPETLSRTLRSFAEKGILRLTRNTIYITRLSTLQTLAS